GIHDGQRATHPRACREYLAGFGLSTPAPIAPRGRGARGGERRKPARSGIDGAAPAVWLRRLGATLSAPTAHRRGEIARRTHSRLRSSHSPGSVFLGTSTGAS